MTPETFHIDSVGDVRLAAYAWLPEGDPRAVVQIHHGMAEHAARYGRLAGALTAAGYAVYATDHRGHGQTAGSEEELGFFAEEGGWELVVDDMQRLNRHIRRTHEGAPVAMLAHSMGSFLARDYVTRYGDSVSALALSGSNGPVGLLASAGRLIARVERKRIGARGQSPLLQKMSFGSYNDAFKPNRTEFDWLSRDEAEVDTYIEDPYCGFDVTVQLWIDLLGGLQRIEDASLVSRAPSDLPIYVAGGEVDPVGGKKGLLKLSRFLRGAGLKDVTLKLYPDARHEILNETNREEVTSDLIAWLDRVLEAP